MEFIFEFFGTLFLEGLGALVESKKVPKPIRLHIITVLCGGLAAALFFAGLHSQKRNETGISVFCWTIALGFFVFWLVICKAIIKPRRKREKKDK